MVVCVFNLLCGLGVCVGVGWGEGGWERRRGGGGGGGGQL